MRLETFDVTLERSLFPEDDRLPRMNLAASLPSLSVKISETKLTELLKIVATFPVPETTEDDNKQELEAFTEESGLDSLVPQITGTNYTEVAFSLDVNGSNNDFRTFVYLRSALMKLC